MERGGGVIIKGLITRKVVLFLFFCGLILFTEIPLAYSSEEQPLNIVINNEVIVFGPEEQKPVIIDQRTYVPLRIISESLGYKVDWDGKNNQVLIKKSLEGIVNEPPVNDTNQLRIVIDNEVLQIPEGYGKPILSPQGRTLIPLRVTAEALDCEVYWAPEVVIISSRPEEEKVAISNKDEFQSTEKDFANLSQITIMGPSIATREQLQAFLDREEPRIRKLMEDKYSRAFIPFPDLIDLYLKIGSEYNIRGDIAFCQAVKETGYFQFTGLVQPHQNNYCGLWATGEPLTGNENFYNGVDPTKVFFLPGYHGLTFATPEIGVEAHIQHLYAYATTAPLPPGKELVDPRFKYVPRGVAPTWTSLNGKWAVPGIGYGESILIDYWLKVMEN